MPTCNQLMVVRKQLWNMWNKMKINLKKKWRGKKNDDNGTEIYITHGSPYIQHGLVMFQRINFLLKYVYHNIMWQTPEKSNSVYFNKTIFLNFNKWFVKPSFQFAGS